MPQNKLSITLTTNQRAASTKDGKVIRISLNALPHIDIPGQLIVKAPKEENSKALFGLVNKWLSMLSSEEQTRLYTFYESARNIVNTRTSASAVCSGLSEIINELGDVVSLDKIANWLEQQPGDPAAYQHVIDAYPDEVDTGRELTDLGGVFDTGHRPGTRTKTFVRHEVRDLIAMTMVAKLYSPLFCCYSVRFKRTFERMTEMSLFDMVASTQVYQHPITRRLYEYINAFIGDSEVQKTLSPVVHEYMPLESYADYVFSMIFCSRLINAALTLPEGKKTFVPNIISTAVRDASDPSSHLGEQKHRDKAAGDQGKEDEGGDQSELDRIAAQFTIAPGDQAMAQWGAEKFTMRELSGVQTHKRLTDYDAELVAKLLSYDRSSVKNQASQKTLASIVVNEFFPATLFHDYLNKKTIDDMLVVSSIWLRQNGFPILADLQLAHGYVDQTFVGTTSILQWAPDDERELVARYPSRPAPAIGRPVMANLGKTMIDELLKRFRDCRWSLGDGSGRPVNLPSDFRSQMVEIIKKRRV